MNFCKKSDEYISLYLDGLLEDKKKEQFIDHIEKCAICAKKLEEASFIADTCNEMPVMDLPENFELSLHKRLVKENQNQAKSRFAFLIQNRKLISVLSTAAVVAVSLLAYNFLPQSVSPHKYSAASNSMTASEPAIDSIGSSNNTAERNMSSDAVSSRGNAANETTNSATVRPSESNPGQSSNTIQEKKGTAKHSAKENKTKPDIYTRQYRTKDYIKDNADIVDNSNMAARDLSKSKQSDDVLYTLDFGGGGGNNNYISNYSEMSLKLSDNTSDINEFIAYIEKSGASEVKASEPKSLVGSNFDKEAGNAGTQNNPAPPPPPPVSPQQQTDEYKEYYMPLSLYNTISEKASQYHLELNAKTDIIVDDITSNYNELNKQISEVDNKIIEASEKGTDITSLEEEKAKLVKERDKLQSERDMITVRIYYIK